MNTFNILPEETIARLSEEVSQKHALRYAGSLEAMRKATTEAIRATLEKLGIRTIETIRLDQGVESICDCPFYGGYTLSNYESGCGAEMSPCWALDESRSKRKWCPLLKGAALIKAEQK